MNFLATVIVIAFIAVAVDRDQQARAELELVAHDEWAQLEEWLAAT